MRKVVAPSRPLLFRSSLAVGLLLTALSSAGLAQNAFVDTLLVANRPEFNPTVMVDPFLINPWGIALRPPGVGGHIWISNAGNASTTTYIGDVNGVQLYQDGLKYVPIDGPLVSYEEGVTNVTGQVYNAASDIAGQPLEFPVSGPAKNYNTGASVGVTSGPAKFVFVSMDGTINAWRSGTAVGMETAVVIKDYSYQVEARLGVTHVPAYTGVAMTTTAFHLDASKLPVADNRLYATDFGNKRIQTFDNQWNDITGSVAFERPAGIPDDWAAFNIQYLGGRLYVTYAQLDEVAEEIGVDVPGEGVGRVVAYDRDGHIIQTFADTGVLNSPWGLALAPAGFGNFGGSLLVGNFGDGTIAAFDPVSGAFLDYLRDASGNVVAIDGLWGLAFGNGVALGDDHALYYTAGPNGEQDGLFGRLNATPTAIPEPAGFAAISAGAALLGSVFARRRRAG